MAFRTNDTQQMSFYDTFFGLTDREQKFLKDSWATFFADEIFPLIDEKPFSVLYSDNEASRPNNPINVIIAALLLKEIFDLSDDELLESILLDPRFQYALHTTSCREQPFSDRTISRFREKCMKYALETGIDLMHNCIVSLSQAIAEICGISGRVRRMDSTMIESNIRTLSRNELLYKSLENFIKYLHNNKHDDLLEGLMEYTDCNNLNRVIYHKRSSEAESVSVKLLRDADTLLSRCADEYKDEESFQILMRCLNEQTVVENGIRRLATKDDGKMNSSILQSPYDTDATYREKAGKAHRGYVANIEESVGEHGSIITEYQYKVNTASDSKMLKEHLSSMEKQEEPTYMTVDGAFPSDENIKLAAEKNIILMPTDLTGKDVPEIYSEFVLNEDETKVIRCPNGHGPKSCRYDSKSGSCEASFLREYCEACPYKDECKPKFNKRVTRVRVSGKKIRRAAIQKNMRNDDYKLFARVRNGAETIPSLLKNCYGANSMPVRGLLRTGFFIGCKIGAINVMKFLRYRRDRSRCASNPVLIGT